jgi:hypothetical protein
LAQRLYIHISFDSDAWFYIVELKWIDIYTDRQMFEIGEGEFTFTLNTPILTWWPSRVGFHKLKFWVGRSFDGEML